MSEDPLFRDAPFEIIISGTMVRASEPQFVYKHDGSRVLAEQVRGFDGEDQYSYRGPDATGVGEGGVGPRDHSDAIDNVHLRGAILGICPLQPTLINVERDTWSLDDLDAVRDVDGRRCIGLRQATRPSVSGKFSTQKIVWLDVEREFIPVRYERLRDARPAVIVRVEYEHHAEDGWLPKAWTSELYSRNGQLSEFSRNEVREAIINVKVAPSDFQIDFPPGTVVTDNRRDGATFVIRKDGTWSPASEVKRRPSQMQWWLITASAVCAILGAVYITCARIRRKLTQQHST